MRFLEDCAEILTLGNSRVSPEDDRPGLAEHAQQLPQGTDELVFHGTRRLETLEQAQQRSQASVQVEDAQHPSGKLRSSQMQTLSF